MQHATIYMFCRDTFGVIFNDSHYIKTQILNSFHPVLQSVVVSLIYWNTVSIIQLGVLAAAPGRDMVVTIF